MEVVVAAVCCCASVAVELDDELVAKADISISRAYKGEGLAPRLVEDVAADSEVGLVITHEAEYCGHNIDMRDDMRVATLQRAVAGIGEAYDVEASRGCQRSFGHALARHMVGDKDKEGALEPLLVAVSLHKSTYGAVAISYGSVVKCSALGQLVAHLVGNVEGVVRREGKERGEEGLGERR